MYRYTREMGLLDGNPPWPTKKLIDLGQGHRANFNLREGEGIVDSSKAPYYDLVFEVPQFANITLSLNGVESHVISAWSDAIQDEYYETLCNWDGFDQQIQLHQWQMIVMGVGPLFWPHAVSWRSQATKARKVLVPQETYANVDELELCVVLHSWRADELESFVAGAEGNDEDYNGWNVPLCRQAVIDCAFREMRQIWGIENYDLYQRAIRSGDLFYGIHRSSRVYVASLFIKEFGGKVSHYIVTDQNLGHAQEVYAQLEEEKGYLYIRKNKFDSFNQVICPFFYDTGPDGTWHSVKGLGPKIYDFCDVSNRTFCQMLDGSVIGSGITLEAQDGSVLEETQIALVGGATVVQPGYKVVQTRISENLQGAMSMRRELQNVLQSNTGSYRQLQADERKEPTLGQAQLALQQQSILSKGATNRYYNSLDRWHRETLRRLMDPAQSSSVPGGKEAKLFKQRCLARGIPEEVFDFKNVRKVTAARSLRYGSFQLRDMATRELVQMIPMMDEISRNHALRARAASLPGIGPNQVDSFFPSIEKKGVPNAHASFAMMENNALRQPKGRALVEPQQNHSIHFNVHDQDLMGHLKDPQTSPMELYTHLSNAGPHMTEHLNLLRGDPTRKQEVKQKERRLQELSRITDKVRQNIEESLRSRNGQNGAGQPQGPQAPPDSRMTKVQGDLALKAQKQKGDFALKVRKQKFDENLKDKKAAVDIRRQSAKARAAARAP